MVGRCMMAMGLEGSVVGLDGSVVAGHRVGGLAHSAAKINPGVT